MSRKRKLKADETVYSETWPGDCGNYDLPVRFDKNGGYVGIDQWSDSHKKLERVLLSPRQVKELIQFAVET